MEHERVANWKMSTIEGIAFDNAKQEIQKALFRPQGLLFAQPNLG
jgi:hypothetical protein